LTRRPRSRAGRADSIRSAFRALVAGAVALTITAACESSRAVRGVSIGAQAPAYSAHLLDGTDISLADRRGQVVLLNIWATWCKPCREEIPALESLHQRHAAEGLDVVGVSIDLPSEQSRVESFARDLGATYPLWLDPDDKVSNAFLAIGVPATYLIDRAGTLRWRHMGPITADDVELNAALASALAERAAPP